MSSTACVNHIKHILKIKKAGHSGTLDSLAQGVLVVAIGSSTRLLQYLQDCKSYESTFRFGQYSDSIDCGTTIHIDDDPNVSDITPSQVQSKLKQFEGDILQQVPLYSAIKIHGQRLSDRVRQGFKDVPKERVISIQSIQLTSFRSGIFPEATLKIDCKSGTYIRSLCRDLAASLRISDREIITQKRKELSQASFARNVMDYWLKMLVHCTHSYVLLNKECPDHSTRITPIVLSSYLYPPNWFMRLIIFM